MRKQHSPAFKAKIVTQVLKEEKTITQIASENNIHPNQISTWKAAALRGLPSLFERKSKVQVDQAAHQQQLEEFYAQIGRLTTQVGWLKKNLVSTLSRAERLRMVERADAEFTTRPFFVYLFLSVIFRKDHFGLSNPIPSLGSRNRTESVRFSFRQ